MTATPQYDLGFAETTEDIAAAQRLRYAVFVEELGGDGPLTDHAARRECDRYDAHARHLILRDRTRDPGDRVVGVYRLMDLAAAQAAGGFSSAPEYDLTPLLHSGRTLLELGRTCVHRDYRGGVAMHHLWHGLARHVLQSGTNILFGVASFHGTDVDALTDPLHFLHSEHLAPPALRPHAHGDGAVPITTAPDHPIDRKAALLQVPSLIKAYLRLGGRVGQGAYIDRAFNTTDVCMVVDVAAMSPRQRALYERPPA